MKVMPRTLLPICLLLFLSFFIPLTAFASSEFKTSCQATYQVDENGLTYVTQEFFIENLLENVYLTEYQFTIGSRNLREIRAADDFGQLDPEINFEEENTKIFLKFPQKVVGKGEKRRLKLSYQSLDFVHVLGKVLEIGIPSLGNADELSNYQVNLIIPKKFGKAVYLSPPQSAFFEKDNQLFYTFEKTDLLGAPGITGSFGEEQIFAFKFFYHLKNESQVPVVSEIALPPDTTFQQVLYETIKPSPQKLTVDFDGNWLAEYRLAKDQNLTIEAVGKAKIFASPRKEFDKITLLADEKKVLLESQQFWPVEEPEIKKLALELNNPQKIYNYLTKNLIYDYGRITDDQERKGALWAFNNKDSALCTEFADLFVALARSAGIPARELEGYAYTSNPKLKPITLEQDVLHAWPEYFDEEKGHWVMIDPTWGNTTGGVDFFSKMDLNHFVFVKRGEKSDYPQPAGSYKGESESKDVQIDFASDFVPKKEVKLTLEMPEKVIAGLPVSAKVFIENKGNLALHQKAMEIKSSGIIPLEKEKMIDCLPPYAIEHLVINFERKPWHFAQEAQVAVFFDDYSISQKVSIIPFFTHQYFLYGMGGLLTISLLLTIKIVRSRHSEVVSASQM